MASRQSSIAALFTRADEQLAAITREYQKSLHAQAIDPALRVDIKNLCENLRSALDYLAHDIRETHCPAASTKDRFYFPILPDRATFDAKVAQWYPGLEKSAPKVQRFLEESQPYHAKNAWLGHFNALNNENKHGDLVEQARTEVTRTHVTGPGGGQVSWGPGVTFGSGVSIMGVPVDPRTQLPVPHPAIKVERITWVDFQFAGIGVSALALLQQAVAGVKAIETGIRVHL